MISGFFRFDGNLWSKEHMLEEQFTIVNKLGLHARASALLVKTASRFKSDIRIDRDSIEVNGKSIMGIMMLAAAKGSSIKMKIDGEDEIEAMKVLGELIKDGFGED
jgi:phosphocarrier protein HPr